MTPADGTTPRHLYLHLPFCRARCRYCDFPTVVADPALQATYVDALLLEVTGLADLRPVTLYVGGGTPTVLAPAVLERLLTGIRDTVGLAPGYEWTVEGNPESVDVAGLDRLAALGVNRLSLGVQSFDDARLRWLGRLHDAARARTAVALARERFGRLSLDLMIGLPDQGPAAVQAEVFQAAALAPDHVSCYALTVEDGTPLDRCRSRGERVDAGEEGQRTCLLAAWEALAAAGYAQYETSNFSHPDARCRHNLAGWYGHDYAAAGAAAVSTIGRERLTRLRDPAAYVTAIMAGENAVAYRETLDDRAVLAETWMLGLRLVAGVRRAALLAAGDDEQRWLPAATGLALRGLVTMDDVAVALTREGRLVQDAVTVALMP